MSVIDIKPVPGANGDIRKAVEIIKNSVPKDTVVLCPYIDHIFPHPGKKYIKPEFTTMVMETEELLAHSGHDNHGHETACAHGAHAWFCDDDEGDD